ncbi:hypothetical protein AWB77_01511 [Caballeronia fortuita]|uniref:Uncharacterized protein n=1 Tax=Caballeronia fortuita TaxID=1777138 RepID=A0A158A927_9BURK|nr:hypothetical protein AWB77_01511 [Caballeronia fortuita]
MRVRCLPGMSHFQALDANGWRRHDTAHYRGISRKVL